MSNPKSKKLYAEAEALRLQAAEVEKRERIKEIKERLSKVTTNLQTLTLIELHEVVSNLWELEYAARERNR